MADQRLRRFELFAALSEQDMDRLCAGVKEVVLRPGDVLFEEGERGDTAYVVVSGDLEIVKQTGARMTLLARRGAGDVIGEMALLQDEPRIATVRAATDVTLLTIAKSLMDELLLVSPDAMRSVFATLLDRLRETNGRLRQTERMAQLGTLTAGIAHELNNPASAAAHAATQLTGALSELMAAVTQAATQGQAVDDLLAAVEAAHRPRLGAMERTDAEAAVETWLNRRGIAEGWRLAPALVAGGLTTPMLDELIGPGGDAAAAVRVLAAGATCKRLRAEITEATRRVSALVGNLRSHSRLDESPVQEADVHQGIEDTLMLLAAKLRDVTLERDYGDDVPLLTAAHAELNQVWTNLIDNAAYAATRGDGQPRVVIRTRRNGDGVLVEVEDNGPGVAPEVRDRLFDAFFTTKPVGEGTGLGLNLSYQIVVFDHRGELTVDSNPGRTTFRVSLPRVADRQ